MLIVDDIQEWAGKAKTLNTFFHIFNHLFRSGKRIILAATASGRVEGYARPSAHPFLLWSGRELEKPEYPVVCGYPEQ